MEFASLTRPPLTEILDAASGGTGAQAGSGRSGLQGAHVHGRSLFDNVLDWLDDLNEGLSEGSQQRVGANFKSNGVLLPENKIGSAVTGSSVHFLEHVPEFNKFDFDVSDPDSNKFLNGLFRAFEEADLLKLR